MTPPVLSLITGTVNREASFKRLLDSIIEHTRVPWELVVSDASDEPYRLTLPDNVVMLPERPRQSYTYGYNVACWQARGQWILFLNDDAEVLKDYDIEAIGFMERHLEIGLGALHYSENGGPFHVNSAWGAMYANFGILHKATGQHIGWFDPDIEMYGSDNALAFKVLLSGKGIADIPAARLLHHSVQDEMRAGNQRNRLQDNETLARKYLSQKSVWLATYQRFELTHSPWDVWLHGRQPTK